MASDESANEQPHSTTDVSLIREIIFKYAGAEAALDELSRCGVDADDFLKALGFAAEMLRPGNSKRHPDWEIPGMPPRRLLKLAERIEGIAGELDTIESHPFIKGMSAIVPNENEEEFSKLPDLLRKRAYFLVVQVKVNKRIYRRIKREIEKRARLSLIEYVRQSTNNRPMYAEVALLLTAGLFAVGCQETVTPESLRTLWHDDLKGREKALEIPT